MPAAGILAEKGANVGNLFCLTPKVLKLHESQFWNILKILGKESTRGGPPTVHEGGGRAPCLVGHLVGLRCPSSGIKCLCLGKIRRKLSGWSTTVLRRNLGGTNRGLQRSCSAGETSLREGEIITIVITINPLIGRGSISINIFTSTISSQTLVHLLYPIFVSKPQIGTCGLLVVLITPCSWCKLVYLVEDHMFRSIMHINTPLIMNMNMLCE